MSSYAVSIPLAEHAPRAFAAMARFAGLAEEEALAGGVPPVILDFVRLRASLLNGCAYCVQKHSADALALGETEARVHAVGRWEDSVLFDEAERAALDLTDAVTRQGLAGGIPPAVLEAAIAAWGEPAAAHLTVMATVINAWNRIGVASGLEPVG